VSGLGIFDEISDFWAELANFMVVWAWIKMTVKYLINYYKYIEACFFLDQ
jgi:hypothetical protein